MGCTLRGEVLGDVVTGFEVGLEVVGERVEGLEVTGLDVGAFVAPV